MRGLLLVAAVSALVAACGSTPEPTAKVAAAEPPRPASTVVPRPTPTDVPPPLPPPEPILLVTDPGVLATLEQHGFALGDWFRGRGSGRVTNDVLASDGRYGPIARVVASDIAEVARRDPQAGVAVGRFPHRLFDVRWLTAKTAHFELVGVVNHYDRVPFDAESCGEIRLIYRLAYATTVANTPVTSRLPMTLGIELKVPRGGGACGTEPQRWVPPTLGLAGDALVDWLVSPGAALDPQRLAGPTPLPHRIVVNAQQVRWPSAVRPDLGGHAEYLLRSFRPTASSGAYEPEPLENTPDVTLLSRNAKLKAELRAWLSEEENLKAVDVGTPFLPERFRATRVESVTPRGLARLQNRPFSALFSASELSSVNVAGLKNVRSTAGLLRRLDELTCSGCHESRSIAGFHLLGDDPKAAPAGNAVASGTSPHLHDDLPRRATALRAVLDGMPADFSQPFPERSSSSGYGAHCSLGTDPTFATWSCTQGLMCQAYDAPASDGVGQCLPPLPSGAGDPCEVGTVKPNANAHRDRVAAPARVDCASNAVCNVNSVGFPGGMCTEGCGGLSPSSTCGSIAVLDPFNACVARGEPFQTCLAEHVRPAGLRACSASNPCRDDYVCARTAAGGACIPPYFLFQLRVDGHP